MSAAFSTADPTNRHHILNRVRMSASRGSRRVGLPRRITYIARRTSARLSSVHSIGSGCVNLRFSGSGRLASSRTIRLRDVRSPLGAMLFPKKR